MTEKLALILGATGGVGCATAQALARRGWTIRAMVRAIPARPPLDAEWVEGDAMKPEDVRRAAEGASLIFHGVNPPGYRNWEKLVVPMLESTIAAAEAVGAQIAFPGTIYNYGPDAFPLLREDAPQHPRSRKGALRVEMERRLEAASTRGVRVLIVRCGDYFGPHGRNSWLTQGMITPGKPLRSVLYPGKRNLAHAWAYLPDVGETFARLLERRDELPVFARFHFAGYALARGVEIAERARVAAGNPKAPVRSFPWPVVVALSPFVPLFRELTEMRYLWLRDGVLLDNAKLVAFLGAEPRTRLDRALEETLRAAGCLDAAATTAGTRPAMTV